VGGDGEALDRPLCRNRGPQRHPLFTDAGYLGIDAAGSDYLDRCETVGRMFGADTTRLDAAGIAARFPFLAVPDGAGGLYEGHAGYVSPRAMVRAQAEVARQQGAVIIADEATAVRPTASGVEVDTARGGTLRAERVLVAIGAFTDACGLLPVDLRLRVLGRTVLLAHIDGTGYWQSSAACRLSSMPSPGPTSCHRSAIRTAATT
jgi:sarcosine oxidase